MVTLEQRKKLNLTSTKGSGKRNLDRWASGTAGGRGMQSS